MTVERKWSKNHSSLGIFFMIVGLALYALSDALLKFLMESSYSVPQTSFIRAVTRIIPLLFAVAFSGGIRAIFKTNHPGRHAARLAVSLAYTYTFMYAFSLTSLTNIYTLSYSSPFFLILLSKLWLKEPVGRERWFALLIGFIGIALAVGPTGHFMELASIIVLLGSFLGALNKILIRRLTQSEPSLAIAIYPNALMILVTLPFLLSSWQPMPWADWGLFAFIGLITATGQYLIAQALRHAEASLLAPVDYSTFVWVIALDYIGWSQLPGIWTLLGAALIVASNAYILYQARPKPMAPN